MNQIEQSPSMPVVQFAHEAWPPGSMPNSRKISKRSLLLYVSQVLVLGFQLVHSPLHVQQSCAVGPTLLLLPSIRSDNGAYPHGGSCANGLWPSLRSMVVPTSAETAGYHTFSADKPSALEVTEEA